MRQRLKELRKALGLNQTEFSKHLGITQTAYSMIESGTRPLSDKYIKVICAEFSVCENWLRTGKGEMFNSSPYEKEFLEVFESLTPESQEFLIKTARELLKTQQRLLSSSKRGDIEEK